jgi:hypothetical protein
MTVDGVRIGDSVNWQAIHSRLVTTSNYNAIADLQTLQITTAHAKTSQSTFTSRFLVFAW